MAMFADSVIPAIEAGGTRAALTLLTAISAVAGEVSAQLAASSQAAVGRLVSNNVAAPTWAGDLAQPLTAGALTRMHDIDETTSVLIGSFQRADRGHSLVIVADHQNCGAADEIYLVDDQDLPTLTAGFHQAARRGGVTINTDTLGAAQFRWFVPAST